jgi:hypothetical protein
MKSQVGTTILVIMIHDWNHLSTQESFQDKYHECDILFILLWILSTGITQQPAPNNKIPLKKEIHPVSRNGNTCHFYFSPLQMTLTTMTTLNTNTTTILL